MKRFCKEYINYKRESIKDNQLMQDQYKAEKLETIRRIENWMDRGSIGIDEGMKILADI